MSSQAATATVNDLKLVSHAEKSDADPTPPPTATVVTEGGEKPKSKKKAPRIFAVLLLAAAATGAGLYLHGKGRETTDDAQVEQHVTTVAARVAGQVKKVLVEDDQAVKAGDVLVELDDADYATRVEAAKADLAAAQASRDAAAAQLDLTRKQADANIAIAKGGLAQASAMTGTTRASIDQAQAQVKAAQAHALLAQQDLDRAQKLIASGAITKSEFDSRVSANDAAQATLAQANAQVVSALSGRANASGTAVAAQGRIALAESAPEQVKVAAAQLALADARVKQSETALHQAELNASYTKIRAERDGFVAKRTVEPGQMVDPSRPLMAVVASTQPWIVANFKETQLAHMAAGERVTVKIDGLDDEKFEGKVASLQAGTGSRFSLLPPDNASGNFTKVTQRVPVRIELTGTHPQLRAGMSAEVTVFTDSGTAE
ncbi:MAG TPA: HlyD family secretion protein [Kofleriaceae bacterium]|jgi:membrane fusion protein (multidrug efflux system)